MRAIILAACAALTISSVALAGEKYPQQVFILDGIQHPDQVVLNQIVERIRAAAEHNAKVLMQAAPPVSRAAAAVDDDPTVFVVWLGEDGRAAALYQIALHEVGDDELEPRGTKPGEKLSSVVIKPDSSNFGLARQAYDEVMASTDDTVEMPQTPAVKKLLGTIASVSSTFANRWPK